MNKHLKSLIILSIIAITFLSIFYGKIILNPNSYLFSSDGDGMKNYYTYAYFIKNNKSNIEFEGMNYPYNENFMYTDCHPFQALTLKMINQYFPEISNYSIGILNSFMLLSIVFTMFILYLIFSKLKINSVLSILASISITILSPQIFRLTGHYALSYSFFIPLTIYLLLLYENDEKRKKSVFLLIIFILFFFFTHGYLGMIASLLVFVYACTGFVNQYLFKKNKTNLKYVKLAITSVVPILIFYIFINISDSHVGRTTNPWGIFENHAELSTVFLPTLTGPLIQIKNFLFNNINQPWEGWSYIGITAMISLFSLLLIPIFTGNIILHKKWFNNLILKQLIVASFFILLFSMLLPFRLILYKIIDNISIVKNFRAIGRFAWIFYFISNIGAIFMLDKIFVTLKKKRKNIIAYFLIILFPFFIFIEGIGYHQYISENITKSPNLFDIKQTTLNFKKDCTHLNSNKYQAIIPLPFFYIGSENFGKSSSNKIYRLSFLFSYHLNLPMTSSYLTRTSILESKNIMQLLSSDYYTKDIKYDIKSEKPFLIVCSNDKLLENESKILKKSKFIIKRDEYSLYEISKNKLFENHAKNEYEHFISIKDSLFQKDNFLVSDTNLYFSYINFSQTDNLNLNVKEKCFQGLLNEYNIIFSIQGKKLDTNRNYIARFWMYNNGKNFGQDCLNAIVFFQNKKDGNIEWLSPIKNPRNSYQINGNWSLVEIPLNNIDKNAIYDLVIKGDNRAKETFYADKLLFSDKDMDLYSIKNTASELLLFKNNNQIKIPIHKK